MLNRLEYESKSHEYSKGSGVYGRIDGATDLETKGDFLTESFFHSGRLTKGTYQTEMASI